MVRTIRSLSQHQDEEEDDATGTDTSSLREGKGAEQKPNNYRSKHSETEQRRRSKINERFQILRDLIPPNDQKRDKASLLLEVIEYIQLLQEKIHVYEGSYQVWSQEPAKLIPWRANHGAVDNYTTHSQAIKNGFLDANNPVQSMTPIEGPSESEFSREYACRVDHSSGPVNHVPGRGIQLIENLVSNYHGSSTAEGARMEIEERTFEKSATSDFYSQGLLKKLTQALQSSGVDVSQANISVQLDVGKQVNSGSNAFAENAVDQSSEDQPASHSVEVSAKESIQAAKRPRVQES